MYSIACHYGSSAVKNTNGLRFTFQAPEGINIFRVLTTSIRVHTDDTVLVYCHTVDVVCIYSNYKLLISAYSVIILIYYNQCE